MVNRNLLLMRHAEADPAGADLFRRLTPKGERQAHAIGITLKHQNRMPEVIVAGHSARTQATANIVAKALDFPAEHLIILPEIYDAQTRTLLEIINATDDSFISLLIIGHNPTISNTVSYLSQAKITSLNPADVALLHADIERWAYLSMDNAVLDVVWEAENLRQELPE